MHLQGLCQPCPNPVPPGKAEDVSLRPPQTRPSNFSQQRTPPLSSGWLEKKASKGEGLPTQGSPLGSWFQASGQMVCLPPRALAPLGRHSLCVGAGQLAGGAGLSPVHPGWQELTGEVLGRGLQADLEHPPEAKAEPLRSGPLHSQRESCSFRAGRLSPHSHHRL